MIFTVSVNKSRYLSSTERRLDMELTAFFIGTQIAASLIPQELTDRNTLLEQKFAQLRLRLRVVDLAGCRVLDHIFSIRTGGEVGIRPGSH